MNRSELINYVNRATKRDQKAIEALYQYTYATMHSMVSHLCSNQNDIEDILQEGYILAFEKLGTLNEKAAFVSWLRKIMVNEWRTFAKNKSLLYEIAIYDDADVKFEDWRSGSSAQELTEISETNSKIRELVQSLPEPQRVCMVLYYYDEMKVEEIAEALGIPEGSVKSRLYYGRIKLRERMEEQGFSSFGGTTLPATEAAASPAMLSKILAAIGAASEGGTAAAPGGIAVGTKIAVSVAALLTAGSIIGGVVTRPQDRQPAAPATAQTTSAATTTATATSTTTTTTTTATSTTATTAATSTAAATTTAPKRYLSFDCEKTDGGVILTRYKGNEPDVVIPETIDGVKVVAIGKNAFKYSNVLQSVVIPPTVTSIGSSSFRECRNLHRVSLGSGLTAIEDAAFLGCALQSVTIPAGVREIHAYAFAYCPSLSDVTVSEGVERIRYAAFRDCPNLMAAALPSSVRVIGEDAFDGASPDFTLTAPEGSYAYEYASDKGYR